MKQIGLLIVILLLNVTFANPSFSEEISEKEIKKLLRQDRKNPETWVLKVEFHLAQNETKEAEKAYERLKELDGQNEALRPLEAELLWQQGEFSKGLKIYQDLAQEERSTVKKLKYLFRLADLYAETGDLDRWESALLQALKTDPLNPLVHYKLGKFKLMQRQDRKSAVRYFREYLKRAKGSPETESLQHLVEEMAAELDVTTGESS